MTLMRTEALAKVLLFHFLGGAGVAISAVHLYLGSGLIPWMPLGPFLFCLAIAFGLLLAVEAAISIALAPRAGRSAWEVFEGDSSSNALLGLAALEPLLNFERFVALAPVYSAVLVAGLWAASKAFYWTGAVQKMPARPAGQAEPDRTWRWVWIAAALYIAIFGALGVLQCRALCVQHIDSVTFEQMYWNTLHGRFAYSNLSEPPFTADHVAVTMYLLLPIFALFPSLETVALFQTAGIGLGALPAYLIAREVLKHRGAALAFAVAYLANPALHYSNLEIRDNVFDPNAFSAMLILWSFFFALRERWGLFALVAAAAMLCREDVCPSVFMMGLYMALVRRRWKQGLLASAFALGWLLLCLYIIVPHYRGGRSLVFGYFTEMGNGFSDMALFILKHPLKTLARITTEQDIQFILELTLPFGLLAFLAPEALLLAAPALGLSLLADPTAGEMVSIQFWYHIIHIPLVYIASVVGAGRVAPLVAWAFQRGWSRRLAGLPAGTAALPARSAAAAGSLAVVCSFFLSFFISKWPLSVSFYDAGDMYRHYSRYLAPPEARHIPAVRALVPESASVCATHYLTQKFSHHRRVWLFPGHIDPAGDPPQELADYVVINLNDRWFRQGFDTLGDRRAIQQMYSRTDFEKIFEADGLVVFKRSSR